MTLSTRVFSRLATGRAHSLTAAVMRNMTLALAARHESVLRLLREKPLHSDTGAELDRQLQVLMALSERFGLPGVDSLTLAEARAQMRLDTRIVAPEAPSLAHVEDRKIPGPRGQLGVRVYTPTAKNHPPALVYFHGGGWVVGDLDTHDAVCRVFSKRIECVVVSVDYRRAPEHRFPAAVDDGHAAFRWVVEHAAELGVDPARVGLAGDSAGGNLSAVVPLRAQREGGPMPALAALIYPATDLTMSRPSHQTFAHGYYLEHEQIEWYRNHYASPQQYENPEASPLFAESLAGLPKTLVASAGFDPLRDEATDYADRLRSAGVDVTYRCYEHMLHGFLGMAGASRGAAHASDDIALWIRDAFGRG